MTADFVGRGWAFPPALSPGGSVQLRGGGAELDGAIRMILGTAPGERVMRPEFGCAIWENVFDPLTARTLGMIEQRAREALARWEPRIDLSTLVANAHPDAGVVEIEIGYRVKATNEYRNLVYPFYVIPQEVRPT
jgi:phage baseplate assembly protein W